MSKPKRVMFYTFYFITSFLLLSSSVPGSGSAFIGVNIGFSDIAIRSSEMAFIINNFKPQFSWWHDNASDPSEIYTVHFTRLYEYFGDDDFLTNAGELTGLSYNLDSGTWTYNISETANEVVIQLTLSGLANGASLEFVVHISEVEQPLPHTTESTTPFCDGIKNH